MKQGRQPLSATLIFCCLIVYLLMTGVGNAAAQTPTDSQTRAKAIFDNLTPLERVGQLFIVTYQGTDTSNSSYVAKLVRDCRVGGVWLQSANIPTNTIVAINQRNTQNLVNTIQRFAFRDSASASCSASSNAQSLDLSTSTPAASSSNLKSTSVPLFIAAQYEGNGQPHTLLIPGLSDLPSNMTLGATWNADNATQVGTIVGQELSASGINMLLGPVLDVIDNPKPDVKGAIGNRSFGGNHYWVGNMGRAYISGVHDGSNGRLLTIAKHFPGAGSTDRQLNQDIPTIQKTADALKKVELAPFFAVTSLDDSKAKGVTDGLMTSHIRYKGLQENVRELTQPISLDAQNLPLILDSPEIAPWRDQGGLIVSGPLGTPAIRKAYITEADDFPAIQIARNAFLAGNDLLLLSDFGPPNDADAQFENIAATIAFFHDRYTTDTEFQQRVDLTVLRILGAKLRIFDDFTEDNTRTKPNILNNLPDSGETLSRIARESVTLLSPGPAELADRIPGPPLLDETIVIFTDDRQDQLCSECDPFNLINQTALQDAIIAGYGPEAGNQIRADQIFSFSFTELENALIDNVDTTLVNAQVDARLASADWIVFAMLDATDPEAISGVVKRFLREKTYDLRDKKLIVFSFDAPYYLDETEVSLLTAYYAFYSKTQRHINAAVRLMFKEFQAQGQAPVSIDAVDYDLAQIVEPSPDQVISLAVFSEAESKLSPLPTNTPTATGEGAPMVVSGALGDRFTIRTGPIVDHNGNIVPDNTLVAFKLVYLAEGLDLAAIMVSTLNGIAETSILVERAGALEITAETGLANESDIVVIEGGPPVVAETPTEVAIVQPTVTLPPTETPLPTPTIAAIDNPTATPVPIALASDPATPTPETVAAILPEDQPPALLRLADLAYSIATLVVFSGLFFFILRTLNLGLETRIWMILMAWIGGLSGYVLYAIFAARFAHIETIGTLIQGNTISHSLTPSISLISALIGAFVGIAIWYFQDRGRGIPSQTASESR